MDAQTIIVGLYVAFLLVFALFAGGDGGWWLPFLLYLMPLISVLTSDNPPWGAYAIAVIVAACLLLGARAREA